MLVVKSGLVSTMLGATLCQLVSGCAAPAAPNGQGQAVEELGRSESELRELARSYLFRRTTESETARIRQVIRGLTPAEARAFHSHLGRLNGYTGFERRAFDASFEYAQAHGKSFLDLTREDSAFIMSELTGAPYQEMLAHEYADSATSMPRHP